MVAVPPTTIAASSRSERRLAEQMPTSAAGSRRSKRAGVLFEQFVAVRQDQHAPAAPDECQRQHRDQHRLAPGAGRFDEGAPHAAVEGVEDRGEGFESGRRAA